MPEPMKLSERRVGFNRTPSAVSVTVDHVPIFIINTAGFGADPPCVTIFEQASVSEDDGIGLIGSEGLNDFLEVVDVALAAGAIKPELHQVAVSLHKLFQLCVVIEIGRASCRERV